MRLSWKLGRVSGIDLFLHPSALLIFYFVSGSFASPLLSCAFAVAVLGSIVLHEFGHALMARRYGIGTADITLYVFGGVARLERMPRSAGPELLIALAGPAVNVAIAAVLGLLYFGSTAILPGLSGFLLVVLGVNLFLGAFNLLPIFPMDGGRVLRALLSGWLGRVRATEVAAAIGQGIAMIGGLAFLFLGNWQGAILSGFVYIMAGLERTQVRVEGRSLRGRGGFEEVPAAPLGFRWTDRGDGVWRLVPTSMAGGERSWN